MWHDLMRSLTEPPCAPIKNTIFDCSTTHDDRKGNTMATARLALNMRMADAGTRAFHGVECPIPAVYTGFSAGSWSVVGLQKNRKPGSRLTSVSPT